MCPLCRVDGERAGPDALGILVPPGRRSPVILRPRGLAWDLVVVTGQGNGDGPAIASFEREQAAALARGLLHALDAWTADGSGRVETVPGGDAAGYIVRVSVGDFCLGACSRTPGRPYQPAPFDSIDTAARAGRSISAVLCPAPGVQQEYYFNTQNFRR